MQKIRKVLGFDFSYNLSNVILNPFWALFDPKALKEATLALVFSCEFCKTSKNSVFIEHLWTAASAVPILNGVKLILLHLICLSNLSMIYESMNVIFWNMFTMITMELCFIFDVGVVLIKAIFMFINFYSSATNITLFPVICLN